MISIIWCNCYNKQDFLCRIQSLITTLSTYQIIKCMVDKNRRGKIQLNFCYRVYLFTDMVVVDLHFIRLAKTKLNIGGINNKQYDCESMKVSTCQGQYDYTLLGPHKRREKGGRVKKRLHQHTTKK